MGFHREADGIVLGLKEAVTINDSIRTNFVYSALEIEETMIPKILDTRNALLEYMDETAAKSYENKSDQDVYLTWLTPDDPNYGAEDTYVWKSGINGRSQNMVLHYNESVRLWRSGSPRTRKTKSRRSTVGTTTRKTALLTVAQVIPLVNAATRHMFPPLSSTAK